VNKDKSKKSSQKKNRYSDADDEESSSEKQNKKQNKNKQVKKGREKEPPDSEKENYSDSTTSETHESEDESSSDHKKNKRTRKKYNKKPKDTFDVLREVEKNKEGKGVYKHVKTPVKGGIRHELVYKFERVYTDGKRHSKPPTRLADTPTQRPRKNHKLQKKEEKLDNSGSNVSSSAEDY